MKQIIENVEREYLKDSIYLIEKQIELENEYWQWMEEEEKRNRLPAKIMILNKEVKQDETLPF
jgi:hypothetical protein